MLNPWYRLPRDSVSLPLTQFLSSFQFLSLYEKSFFATATFLSPILSLPFLSPYTFFPLILSLYSLSSYTFSPPFTSSKTTMQNWENFGDEEIESREKWRKK